MTDVGQMTVKFNADTDDLRRGVRDMNKELSQMQVNAARAQVRAARMSQVASATTLGATVGGIAVQTRRGRSLARQVGGMAVRRGLVRAGAGMAARSGLAAAAGLGSLGPLLGAIAGLVVLTRGISAGIRKMVSIADQQVDLLSSMNKEMVKQGRTAAEIQAIQSSRLDPRMGSARAARARMAAAGTAITAQQIDRMVDLQTARLRRDEAMQASLRQIGEMIAPLMTVVTNAQAAGFRQVNAGLAGRGAAGSLFQTIADLGGGAPLSGGLRVARGLFGAAQAALPGRGPYSDSLINRGPLGGPLERELFELRRRGPGAPVGAAPTVRAGGESEYQFRVQRQREQLQRDQTRAWQDQVLALLRQMVDEGKIDRDELYRTEIGFGRNASVEGVN